MVSRCVEHVKAAESGHRETDRRPTEGDEGNMEKKRKRAGCESGDRTQEEKNYYPKRQ